MYKVIISAPYMQKEIDRFIEELKNKNIDIFIPEVKERLEEYDLLKIIENAHGIICGDDRITEKVIDKAKKLKVIVKWGTGIDSINKEYAESKGIKVFNTPNAFTEPVSDTVIGFMLCFARNIISSDKMMKQGKWEKIRGFTLQEKTLGIIGVGNIGRRVAEKAKVFGMKIIGNDIKKIEDPPCKMVSLNELLKQADFVSINCDLNETSYHLISIEKLKLMKKDAIIINTARGPIIKEEDLILALKNKILAGAALDVFEYEPLPEDSPLRRMDNVILSPHNSNSSKLFWDKVHRNSLNMLYRGLGL